MVFNQVRCGVPLVVRCADRSSPVQCKELLRPVKKWLTLLQSPPAQGDKEEVLQQYKKVGGAALPVVGVSTVHKVCCVQTVPDLSMPSSPLLTQCLIAIGDHIRDRAASDYPDAAKCQEWKRQAPHTHPHTHSSLLPPSHPDPPPCSNMWVFVAKFTSKTAQKLHKLYKHAKRGLEEPHHADSPSPTPEEDHTLKGREVCLDVTQHPSFGVIT